MKANGNRRAPFLPSLGLTAPMILMRYAVSVSKHSTDRNRFFDPTTLSLRC
jgi:hypothetical protein